MRKDKPHNPRYFFVLLVLIPAVTIAIGVVVFGSYLSIQSKININMLIEGDWPFEADSVLGYAAAKNSYTLRHHVHNGMTYNIYVDKLGARVNGMGQQVPRKVDLLTVGGSYSWGHGLENDQTFTEILSRDFNVPAANFSYASYGTVQSLQLLERHIGLQPKIILYGFISDHIQRNLSPCARSYAPYCMPVSYMALDDDGNPYIHAPPIQYSAARGKEFYEEVVYRKEFGWADHLWGLRAILAVIKKATIWRISKDKTFRKKSMAYLIGRMSRVARQNNALMVVVNIPDLHKGRTDPPPPELMDSLNKEILFIDLTNAVDRHFANPNYLSLSFPGDVHPNSLGHQLMAREIRQVLQARGVF